MSVALDLDCHLAAIVSGDADAFGAWMAGAEAPIRRSLRSFATVLDTEAVLQETLLRIWQVAPRFEQQRVHDGRPNALLRFAFRVARNAAIDEMRKRRAAPLDPDALARVFDEAAALEEPCEPDPALRKILERCRSALKGPPKAAFDARMASGGATSDRDLAKGLDMQLNTFLKNIGRARAALVECLARSGVALGAP